MTAHNSQSAQTSLLHGACCLLPAANCQLPAAGLICHLNAVPTFSSCLQFVAFGSRMRQRMLPRRGLHLLTRATLCLVHLLSCLLGLTSASWLAQSRPSGLLSGRVYFSWYWRHHGCLVLLFVLCFSPYAFWIVYTRMDFLRQNRLLFIVGCHRYAFLLGSALLTLYKHTHQQRCLIALANKLLSCRRRLLRMLHTSRLQRSARMLHTPDYVLFYALVVAVFSSSTYTVFLLTYDRMARDSHMYFYSLCFIYGCQLCLQLSLCLYTLAVLLISHLTKQCNLLLAQLLNDAVRCHQLLSTRRRMRDAQTHWLSLELWRLLRLHDQLERLSVQLCSLHNIQLVAFVHFVSIEMVMHSFFTYFVTYSRWFLRKFHKSAPWNVHANVYVAALMLQVILVVSQVHRQRQIFNATRRILREGVEALPADCRLLRRTLHMFGLQLQVNERVCQLLACGLFKLNNGLLFGIVQTIITYTIILIQFDKIING